MTAENPEEAQLSLDRFLATTGNARIRRRDALGVKTTVGELADTEPLAPLPPVPYPATVSVPRVVAANATVAFRGNRYSVPPGLTGTSVTVEHRLSGATLQIVAPSRSVLAEHRLAPAGAGTLVRSTEHHAALEKTVLSAFSTKAPCDKKPTDRRDHKRWPKRLGCSGQKAAR
jgi:hypothetical protein